MNIDILTPEEIAEGFVLPTSITIEEQRKANQQLAVARQQRAAERTQQEMLYGRLLQLKIQIQDYIRQESFDSQKTFATFLNKYIELQGKKKHEIAAELDIHKTLLSQLLSGSREPSEELFIRLEFHSNQFITARDWFRLSVKNREYSLMTDTALRTKEQQHVKGLLLFFF